MNKFGIVVVVAVLAATTLACEPAPSANGKTSSENGYVDIPNYGKAKCIPYSEMHISDTNEITGEMRLKLLTPEAAKAGIRIMVSSSDISNSGTTVLTYADPLDHCVVWSESLTLQEYSARLGLNPNGISPFYQDSKQGRINATP